ncbi:MAG: hypothetical protein GY801_00020 [bacterium]|nr:hypothetical protein [bacterium]
MTKSFRVYDMEVSHVGQTHISPAAPPYVAANHQREAATQGGATMLMNTLP